MGVVKLWHGQSKTVCKWQFLLPEDLPTDILLKFALCNLAEMANSLNVEFEENFWPELRLTTCGERELHIPLAEHNWRFISGASDDPFPLWLDWRMNTCSWLDAVNRAGRKQKHHRNTAPLWIASIHLSVHWRWNYGALQKHVIDLPLKR